MYLYVFIHVFVYVLCIYTCISYVLIHRSLIFFSSKIRAEHLAKFTPEGWHATDLHLGFNMASGILMHSLLTNFTQSSHMVICNKK